MTAPVVDLYLIYSFLERLATPFDKTRAFKLGLIDENGERLKKAKTPEEKAAMGYFDRLVFNLKRLLAKVPGGSSQIATFAAALMLLREEDARLDNEAFLLQEFHKTLIDIDMDLYEEVVANATGASVAGTGDTGDAWKKKKKKFHQWKPSMLRRAHAKF